jgi:anti-sigma B factor antagonist
MAPIASPPGSEHDDWPPPPPRVCREDGRVVVWLEGEQDLFTAPSLHAVLATEILAGGDDLVVDLSGVTFIDGSMLAVLTRDRDILRDRDRCLTVRAPSHCAQRLLDVCGLHDLVEVLT